MKYLMGIDIGSTSLKAIIFDLQGKIIASGSRPTEVSYLDSEHPQWAYWEPEKIWGGISSAIQEALSKIAEPKMVKGVAVTGMGQDGLPIDEQGNWLYPFISWHCPRTQSQAELWAKFVGLQKIFSITGRQLWAGDSIFRLMWLKEHHPEILAQTDKWLLIEDFVNLMLCGKRATDFSMASCTSAFNLKERAWSDELIKTSGIAKSVFPDVLPSGKFLGEVTKSAAEITGLAEGTPVLMGGHDYHCAALTVGAFQPGVLMDITGTWDIMLAASTEPNLDNSVLEAGLLVECHVAQETYSTMAAAVSADMLEWFRNRYGLEEKKLAEASGKRDWDYLIEKSQSAPCGSKGVFFLPHFSGSSCPTPDGRSLGAFIGLHNRVEKGDMLRAIIEGLNYQFREMLLSLTTSLQDSETILAVGGATRNRFWMQNKADVTGKIIETPDIEEATALGAAILAGIGIGCYKDEQEAYERTFRPGKTYEPNPKLHEKYNGYFEIYKQLYPALKPINWEISAEFK